MMCCSEITSKRFLRASPHVCDWTIGTAHSRSSHSGGSSPAAEQSSTDPSKLILIALARPSATITENLGRLSHTACEFRGSTQHLPDWLTLMSSIRRCGDGLAQEAVHRRREGNDLGRSVGGPPFSCHCEVRCDQLIECTPHRVQFPADSVAFGLQDTNESVRDRPKDLVKRSIWSRGNGFVHETGARLRLVVALQKWQAEMVLASSTRDASR